MNNKAKKMREKKTRIRLREKRNDSMNFVLIRF